jgi:excisionase family DNA binding protein
MTGRLMTSQELADFLNVSIRTVEDWRYRGGGPPVQHVGGKAHYKPADVDRWLKQQRRTA